jgi:hypothetical protein
MNKSLKDSKIVTDKLWNQVSVDNDADEDTTLGLFDEDGSGSSAKKKKKKKKKKKDGADDAAEPISTDDKAKESEPLPRLQDAKEAEISTQAKTLMLLSPPAVVLPTPSPLPNEKSQPSSPAAHLRSWFTALERNLEQKRIMSADVLHPARNLRGKPEVVFKDILEDESFGDDDDEDSAVPWASWGMKSVKTSKWEDLIKGGEGYQPRSSDPAKSSDLSKPSTVANKPNVSTTTTHSRQSSQSSIGKFRGALSTKTTKELVPSESPTRTYGHSVRFEEPSFGTTNSGSTPAVHSSPVKPLHAKQLSIPKMKSDPKFTPRLKGQDMQEPRMVDLPPELPTRDAVVALDEIHAKLNGSPQKSAWTPKPSAISWDRPTPWSVVQRISKSKLFAIDLGAFGPNVGT